MAERGKQPISGIRTTQLASRYATGAEDHAVTKQALIPCLDTELPPLFLHFTDFTACKDADILPLLQMQAQNICRGLSAEYPEFAELFEENLTLLLSDLQKLEDYGKSRLADLSRREIITFHDGFAYLADAFGIEIVEAIEEESGAEASAKELIHLIEEVRLHDISAIFVEANGSGSAASIIAAETGAKLGTLSMAMSGDDYFSAMYENIDSLKEALQ